MSPALQDDSLSLNHYDFYPFLTSIFPFNVTYTVLNKNIFYAWVYYTVNIVLAKDYVNQLFYS